MANIATVQTVAFLKPGAARDRVSAHGLLRAATRYFGRSYCVPPWHFDDYPLRCLYVQHGEKWSPTGVERVWERYADQLDAIWVRWSDSGGDHDRIFRFAGSFGDSRLCRYRFDAVRLYTSEVPGAGWRLVQPYVWETDRSGTYLADNDRCDLLADFPRMPSRTTPARARYGPTWELAVLDEFSSSARELEPLVNACAEGVEFCWHGRPTRAYQRRGERWLQWNLDDWDNCCDPGWLQYQADRLGLAPEAAPVS